MGRFIVDGHCDTLTKLNFKDLNFWDNKSVCVDINKLTHGKVKMQFMAIFINQSFDSNLSLPLSLHYIDLFNRLREKYLQFLDLVTSYEDILKNKREGKISILLTLEGGEPIKDDLSLLRIFYELGVRCITLTWNRRNHIADGVDETITNGGLTVFGRTLVKEMNKLGIIVDVSHLSQRGFEDVISIMDRPIIASHSNAYTLCSHKRNLKDFQIKEIAKLNGLIGVNFCKEHLEADPRKASLASVVNHIEYIAKIGGIDCVGLGSDYDGASIPNDIHNISHISKIEEEMKKRGFTNDEINKVLGHNYLRVLRRIL